MTAYRIQDADGATLGTGQTAAWGDELVLLIGWSAPYTDYNDEIQGPAESTPQVQCLRVDGSTVHVDTANVTPVRWSDYPDGPKYQTYEATDLLVTATGADAPTKKANQ